MVVGQDGPPEVRLSFHLQSLMQFRSGP